MSHFSGGVHVAPFGTPLLGTRSHMCTSSPTPGPDRVECEVVKFERQKSQVV